MFTCWDDQICIKPRSVSVDHEVGKDESVQSTLAQSVVLAHTSNSLKLLNVKIVFEMFDATLVHSMKWFNIKVLFWNVLCDMSHNIWYIMISNYVKPFLNLYHLGKFCEMISMILKCVISNSASLWNYVCLIIVWNVT